MCIFHSFGSSVMFLAKLTAVIVIITAFLWRDTFDPESLRGARVLVTGSSTGLGEQIAYHYARFGAQVVVTARRESVLQKVSQKCLELGAQRALYVSGDMADASDPGRVLRFALDQLGGLDYLVLNHIGPSPFAMWDGDVEHARWLMQVNFLSYIEMAAKAMPYLEDSRGSIIVVSSLLGKMTTPFSAPYSATKSALNGFFGTLQHELSMQKSNVSVTISILALIDTESAMEKIRGHSNAVPFPATEAALHVIKAGQARQQESFYPFYTYCLCLIRDWFPYFRDLVIRSSFY
ncbi:hydroxysteroid 11-beta-dehydrogenase 1-like protein [Brienomyrus brachyistius]|uniref:hydroxysteroid 11-beta-dehydrogenase 1-like protein n=1 Tax=Brienomyrus brachyistius TaxID=42636 RepID=UPI0020B22560|nr:hydroxysteroid 11-beta-dehydrogenase 1-like protein [Brienomyrus brachyistius]